MTSLFSVVTTDSRTALVQLRDLLEPDRPDVMLTDIAMSQFGSKTSEVILFLRVVGCQGIQMSSGSFFAFSQFHRQRLLNEYARRMETVPPDERSQRRFIFFFQRFRELGEEQAFDEPR